MIVLRYSLKGPAIPVRSVLQESCKAHPQPKMRVYNSISGDQGIVLWDVEFDDAEGSARCLVHDYCDLEQSLREMWRKLPDGISLLTREIWRLVD